MLDYSYIQKNKEVLNDDQWHSRVAECPLECNDNILIEDRLEKGCIRICDYTGGAIELPNSLSTGLILSPSVLKLELWYFIKKSYRSACLADAICSLETLLAI